MLLFFLYFFMNYFTNLKFVLFILNYLDVHWQIWGLMYYPTALSLAYLLFVVRPPPSAALRSASVGGVSRPMVGVDCALPPIAIGLAIFVAISVGRYWPLPSVLYPVVFFFLRFLCRSLRYVVGIACVVGMAPFHPYCCLCRRDCTHGRHFAVRSFFRLPSVLPLYRPGLFLRSAFC